MTTYYDDDFNEREPTAEEQAYEDARLDAFLTDPRKGAARWIAIWEVMSRYETKRPMDTGAEHDIFYFYADRDLIDPDSEDGLLLNRLGCSFDSDLDSWSVFT